MTLSDARHARPAGIGRAIRPIHLLSFLFFLQAWLFGIFVTLPGDIPDESGHYAYVIDMTKGRPLPVLGRTDNDRGAIPNNLWRDWGITDGGRYNYIVQHPPLYYAVAAVPYSIAKQFTSDRIKLAKATRIVSALSLGLLVLVCFHILLAVRLDERIALAVASWIGFIPTVTHLSSGITNDMFLTLMCALATLSLVRFLSDQRLPDAYWCAFWLACAGATKMTAWVLIAGFVGILLFEMRRPGWRWLIHAGLLTALSFSSAIWWMRRNIYHFGNPFYVAGSDAPALAPNYTLLDYLQQQPFFDWLFKHFYGLAGFSGYCNSAESALILERFCKGVRVTVVEGISLTIFSWISVICATILLGAVLLHLFRNTPLQSPISHKGSLQGLFLLGLEKLAAPRWLPALLALAAAGASTWVFIHAFKLDPRYSNQTQVMSGMLMASAIAGLCLVFTARSMDSRLLAYGPILLCLFTLLLFIKGHEAYVISQRAAGIQGRYLYPFLPLLIASFGIAVRPLRWLWPLVGILTLALAWAHLNAYINTLVPFFTMVRL